MSVHVVLLNGVGSAGKSSIAAALQRIATRPLLHVAMDAFFDMIPHGRPGTTVFERRETQAGPEMAITSGAITTQAMTGMRRAVAALADAGNHLIVDDVMLHDEWTEYAALLAHHTVHRVGVICPLEVLVSREAARGDRLEGLARWQFDRVHRGQAYDLEVDTSAASAEACARVIRDRFEL